MTLPRLIRSTPDPLGLYLRPGWNDHGSLEEILAEGAPALSGLVCDPRHAKRHEGLREAARRASLEVVLDPCLLELATPGGHQAFERCTQPWVGSCPHTIADLSAARGTAIVDSLANCLKEERYSAIVSPSHFLEGASDPWLGLDRDLTVRLRDRLDAEGLHSVPIYYRLATTGKTFRDATARERLKQAIAALPIDALWLKIHPFGTTQSGPNALSGFIEACWDLADLGLPLVGEHTGTVGLSLLAFGAVGGIEGGITVGESASVSKLSRRQPERKGFAPQPRVYIEKLGTFMNKKVASEFFGSTAARNRFGCQHDSCCRRASDMLDKPKRHFAKARQREVSRLSRSPEFLRPQLYMDEFLRPATDLVIAAEKRAPELAPARKRLEAWRHTLGALIGKAQNNRPIAVPTGGRFRRRIGA